jgi:collagenase-like PrtC family protease
VQVQSAHTHNALAWIPKLRDTGVDVLRLSPTPEGFFEAVAAFRKAADGQDASIAPGDRSFCDGYLSGGAGMRLSTGPAT